MSDFNLYGRGGPFPSDTRAQDHQEKERDLRQVAMQEHVEKAATRGTRPRSRWRRLFRRT